jgi:2-iminoacetate synthase ThiH
MHRRPAQVTQADIARVIRAAKQAGAAEVVIQLGEQSVIVRFTSSTGGDDDKNQDFVL